VARRSGLGKRLQQILDEQSAKPAQSWENQLLSRDYLGPPEMEGWEDPTIDSELGRRLFEERRREEQRALDTGEGGDEEEEDDKDSHHALTLLTELGIDSSLFNVKTVAKAESEGGGPSSSTRVASYLFSRADGTSATYDAIVETYNEIKEAKGSVDAKEFKRRLECNLYIRWQRGSTRSSTGYVSKFGNAEEGDGMDLLGFEDFKTSPSLGTKVEEYRPRLSEKKREHAGSPGYESVVLGIFESSYVKNSSDAAAGLL
jgi:hypothetical protein